MTGEAEPPVHGEPPDVPGYVVGRRLGAGASSEVWSAVALADRRRVALKVVAPTARAEPQDSVELAVLRGLGHPHVVRQYGDLELPDGRQVLVLELAAAGSLTRVVRARGHLTPGETVTVLTALARGLGELHRMGVTHADLAPANVLLHADGRPVLGDVGRSRIAGHRPAEIHGTAGFLDPAVLAGADPGPESDIYSLGAVGWFCLTGQPPPPPVVRAPGSGSVGLPPEVPATLAATLDRALAPDPEDRPSAAELARALYRSCAAEPLRLAGGGDPLEELTHRIRRIALDAAAPVVARPTGVLSRLGIIGRLAGPTRSSAQARSLVGAALALLAVTATLAGSRAEPAAAGDRAASRPVAHPSRRPADATSLRAVVAALTRQRAAGFAEHPGRGPGAFDAPGSPAWSADAASLSRLARSDLRYRGLALVVRRVEPIIVTAQRASLLLVFDSSAYDVVDATGAVQAHRAAQTGRSVRVELVRATAGWRVERSG